MSTSQPPTDPAVNTSRFDPDQLARLQGIVRALQTEVAALRLELLIIKQRLDGAREQPRSRTMLSRAL